MTMIAQIISGIQQKGGSCKSTLLQCIGAKLGQSGAKVLIIDTDQPQFSCIEWAEEQDIENVDTLNHTDEDTILDVITAVRGDYDVILIDTAGFDSRMASYAIQASDLILIPSGGSKSNVKGAAKTWRHAKISTENNKTPPLIRLVVWGVKKNTNVYSHALETIKDMNIPTINYHVGNLVGFEAMSWNGGLPSGAASESLNLFMTALRGEHLIEYYNKPKEAAHGKAA
jgi:chromosome partitioning protein